MCYMCINSATIFFFLRENVKRKKKHKSEIQKSYTLDICMPYERRPNFCPAAKSWILGAVFRCVPSFQQNAFCLHMINYKGGFSSFLPAYPLHPTTVSVRFLWGNIPSKDEKFAHMMLFLWNFSYVFKITWDKSLRCESMKKCGT